MANVQLETVKNWRNIVDPTGEWLKYETQGKNIVSITCLLCSKFVEKLKMKRNFNPAFINGISGARLKKDNVIKHWKSEMHTTASNLEHKPDSLKKVMKTPIGKAISKVSNDEENKMRKLIEIAYFIAKKELPFTLFPDIAKLEKMHGVKLGDTYLNDKQCRELTECIADTLKEDLKLETKDARYVSVMVDESTDVSVNEKLLVYMKFFCSDGFVKNKFIALKNLTDGTAKGVLKMLLEILADYGVEDISEKIFLKTTSPKCLSLWKKKKTFY